MLLGRQRGRYVAERVGRRLEMSRHGVGFAVERGESIVNENGY